MELAGFDMRERRSGWILCVWLLLGFRPDSPQRPLLLRADRQPKPFSVVLHYNVYTFSVSAVPNEGISELIVRAYRGNLLLTRFQIPADGIVLHADVADLDNNRFPELYVYARSDGSGSFGNVYAWQFLLSYRADIKPMNWFALPDGYMGHDSLWVEGNALCRRYPVFQPGDANFQPSGGLQTVYYQLQPVGMEYVLLPKRSPPGK